MTLGMCGRLMCCRAIWARARAFGGVVNYEYIVCMHCTAEMVNFIRGGGGDGAHDASLIGSH